MPSSCARARTSRGECSDSCSGRSARACWKARLKKASRLSKRGTHESVGTIMKTGALLLAALLAMPSGAPAQDKRFDGANGWLNSPRPGAAELRGKVVLVNFWTYTCINWQRTLPYVRAWAEKYKDQGLVVIGVHTPEFGFEKNVDNIRPALKMFRIDYPV